MIKLDVIAQDLFNKIRGRFPSITIGTSEGTVTNDPKEARFFDFNFREGAKVNVTLDDKNLTVMYNDSLIEKESDMVKKGWFDFMKEMRQFAKKRMLQFDTRNITKNNLDKRDYDYQVKNRPGEQQMSESTMYGTSRNSIQDVGNARVLVKHSRAVNQEQPGARTRDIHSLYVESGEGERFKYPFRHLNGARAMARHVAEGGNQYDDFGKYIVSLSEELSNLRKFKTYMNRSAVMAEGLRDYMGVVNERIDTVKDTILKLQKETHYKESFKDFAPTVNEEVPEDISNSWIDELTIRQFNEDLKSVFPYIYKLVSEANKVKELGPEDLDEVSSMGMNKYGLAASKIGGKFKSYQHGELTGEFDSMEELQKHQMELVNKADDKKEASGPEGGMEPHAHKFYIDGDYDQDRGISDKDCEQMEMACKKAGIECKCEPDEMRQGGVVIHTMAPRDAVMDVLDKEGYNVEEAIIEPADDFADRINSINPKHDAPVQEARELGRVDKMILAKLMKELDGYKSMIAGETDRDDKKMYKERLRDLESMIKNVTRGRPIDTALQDELSDMYDAVNDAVKGVNEAVDKSALEAWYNKYKKYQGNNGDELPQGMLRGHIDTGILTDGVEDNEFAKAVTMLGGDRSKAEEELFDDPEKFAKMLPITNAMQEDYKKVMGVSEIDEDNCTEAAKILGEDIVGFGVAESPTTEGNEFAQKVRELKAKGAKPGTKFKTSDGEEHTLEQAITKVGLNVEDFFTAEELATENPMTQADLDSERFGELHDFEEFKDAVMSDIEDPKGAYAGKDKKEIIAMLRKEADSIGYADVSDGDRRPEEPTWLNKIADDMENEKTPDQTEEEDPDTEFTRWLKSNYNKSPRDLKGDEYVKMSKEFQASKKKEGDETEEPEIDLEEFVKSLYDYTSNSFPKGETAVLTAVEKKYGDNAMKPAAEMMKELVTGQDQEMERIKKLAGV